MLTAGPLPFPILIQEEVVKEVGGARLAGFNEPLERRRSLARVSIRVGVGRLPCLAGGDAVALLVVSESLLVLVGGEGVRVLAPVHVAEDLAVLLERVHGDP